jgi:predicted nucleic acid binding AN1-type Zn finger protein
LANLDLWNLKKIKLPDNRARGGSAVIIINNIQHSEREKYVTRDIQATTVTFEASKQRLTVSAV